MGLRRCLVWRQPTCPAATAMAAGPAILGAPHGRPPAGGELPP